MLKLVWRGALAALFGVALAQATVAGTYRTKDAIGAEISNDLPTNHVGQISAAALRALLGDMASSYQQATTVNTQTGTSYAIGVADNGELLIFNNSGAIAVSVPTATLEPFAFYVTNGGSGTVTLTPVSGTIGGSGTLVLIPGASAQVVSDGFNWQVTRSVAIEGTVTAGTANQLAYYPSSTANVAGLTSANNSVLTTDGSGAPSWATPTSWLDTAFCNTVGYIVARTTGAWVCSNNIPINVVWFGADPTGVADSTTAITDALATSSHNFGPNVYFPCGVYIATNLVVAIQDKKLMGDGIGCSTLKWKASTSGDLLTFGDASGDFQSMSIENMTIEGNGSNQSAGNNNCVHVQNIHQVHFTNVGIHHCFKTDLLVQDNAGHQNNASGVMIVNSEITEWNVGGAGGNGIDFEAHMEGSEVTNSWIFAGSTTGTGSSNAAIFLNGNINGVNLTGNTIFHNGTLIYSKGNVNATGNGLGYNDANSQCIIVDGSGAQSNVFVGNSCVMSTGLTKVPVSFINGTKGNLLCGNVINSNGAAAVTAAVTEDSTSKPNNYCGPNPSSSNQILQLSGSFTAEYNINGPTTGTGTASVAGCTAGACTNSTDFSGSFTVGSGVTSAAISFATSWITDAPNCVGNDVTNNTRLTALTATTSALTANFGSSVTSDVVSYSCSGKK